MNSFNYSFISDMIIFIENMEFILKIFYYISIYRIGFRKTKF